MVPESTKAVALAVEASGGAINVTYRISEAVDAIDIPWSVGEVADGEVGSTVIDAPVTSFAVTGTGSYNAKMIIE
jgi:hypothetical protein